MNGVLAATDFVPFKAVGGTVLKGGLKLGPTVWRVKPWEKAKGLQGVREWMTEKGFAEAGQPVHHWAIPQGGWGKAVPDAIKNQLWNLKPMKDAVEHGRVHGRYTVDGVKLPQFNFAQRVWYGTPDWLKAANVSIPGHLGTAAGLQTKDNVQRSRK